MPKSSSVSPRDAWQRPLSRPIKLRNGDTLSRLTDARAWILRQNDRCQESPPCQYAAELLLKAAEKPTSANIREATDQMERALMVEGRLEHWTPVCSNFSPSMMLPKALSWPRQER